VAAGWPDVAGILPPAVFDVADLYGEVISQSFQVSTETWKLWDILYGEVGSKESG